MQRIILALILVLFLSSSSALGANSWVSRSSSTTQDLNDVQFMSASTGIAAGNNRNIIRTTNYGRTWSVVSEAAVADNFNGISFPTSLVGYAAGLASGGGGVLYKSTDSGANWSLVPTDISVFNDVFFFDALTGWQATTAAVNLLSKTVDGGSAWTVKDTGLTAERAYYGVYFVDSQTGWLVGNPGLIFTTVNGADLWTEQVSGTANQLNDVFFINSTTGWVVGNSGTILKTTNGGTGWAAQVSGTANNLNAVYFVDASNGWVVGAGGTILKTTDGGTTWTAETSGTTANLNGVHFTDVNNGCAVGAGGVVLKYSQDPTLTSAKHGRFTTFSQGGIYTTFTITGTGFNSGVAPAVTFDTADITAGAVTSFSDTSIVLPVTFAAGTTVGNHTMTVTNPEGGSATLTISVLADSAGPTFSSVKINGTDYSAGTSIPFVSSFTGDIADVTGISISPTDDLEFTLRITSGNNTFYKTFTGSDVYTAATSTTGSFRATPNRVINLNTGEEVTFGSAVGVDSLFTLSLTATDINGNQGTSALSLKFAGQASSEKAISNVLQAPNKNPTPANPVTIQFESKENLGARTIPVFSAAGPVANLTANIVTGTNRVTWDGNTFAGQRAASGLYLVRIKDTMGKIVIFR